MTGKRHIALLFLSAIALLLAHGIIPHHHVHDFCALAECHPSRPDVDHPEKQEKNPWDCRPYSHVLLFEHKFVGKFKGILASHFELACEQVRQVLTQPESRLANRGFHTRFVLHDPSLLCSLLRAPPIIP